MTEVGPAALLLAHVPQGAWASTAEIHDAAHPATPRGNPLKRARARTYRALQELAADGQVVCEQVGDRHARWTQASGNICQRNGGHVSDCAEPELCGRCDGLSRQGEPER